MPQMPPKHIKHARSLVGGGALQGPQILLRKRIVQDHCFGTSGNRQDYQKDSIGLQFEIRRHIRVMKPRHLEASKARHMESQVES